MKVALVCDSMSAYCGAERVIEQILHLFPRADLFATLDTVPSAQRDFLGGRPVRCSFLQRLPGVARYYRKLLPLWPLAVEQLDVTQYDLVISSHHSVAYGVLTRPGQVHVSYVHSPMRYAWDLQHDYLRASGLDSGPLSPIARYALHKLRIWDYAAAQRPDAIAANSHFVASRLFRTHRRRAEVIHPPVAIEGRCRLPRPNGDYYLSLGRLVPYKRVDLLVRAFARMPHRRLLVVGDGPEMRAIAAIGTPNVELLGYQSDERIRDIVAGARAYVFAGTEDFGITAVEMQAAGTPVIAYRMGGIPETVIGPEQPNPTGLLFTEQTEEAIIGAIDTFERHRGLFGVEACVANAAGFSVQRFRSAFAAFVEDALVAARSTARQPRDEPWHWASAPAVDPVAT